jgi:hypothetical protein
MGDEASTEQVGNAAEKVSGTAKGAVDAVKPYVSPEAASELTQPEAQATVRGAAEGAAQEAGVPTVMPRSVRDEFNTAGENVLAKGKSCFQQIDAATDNAWQVNQNALKAVGNKIRTAVDEDVLSDATARQADLLEQQEQILAQAREAGVPEETIQAARSSWRQGSELQDLQAQINFGVKGRAAVTEAGEMIDASKIAPRLQKMYDSGRLQDALGEEGATKFLHDVDSVANTSSRMISRAKLVSWAVKYGRTQLTEKSCVFFEIIGRGGRI